MNPVRKLGLFGFRPCKKVSLSNGVKKKYILEKKRAKFKKRLKPETKRYYNTLHQLNKFRLKKVLKEKPRPQDRVRPSIQVLLLWAIYFFLVNLLVFLQNNFGWFK